MRLDTRIPTSDRRTPRAALAAVVVLLLAAPFVANVPLGTAEETRSADCAAMLEQSELPPSEREPVVAPHGTERRSSPHT
jgi:endonuclease/exonuclease/phosphatase family metal-dependent hydrolase